MPNFINRRATLACVAAIAVGVFLTACSQQVSPVEAPSAASDILTRDLPSDLSARGVLLAVILLSTADIEASLEAGLVTPAEVEAARQATNDDTVDLWRQRAEAPPR
ncbi:MAG: hypothetical protein JJE28_05235 [Actinomycetales bacterium]|nr:hypothetical protein [Actinomycetales bacterium]